MKVHVSQINIYLTKKNVKHIHNRTKSCFVSRCHNILSKMTFRKKNIKFLIDTNLFEPRLLYSKHNKPTLGHNTKQQQIFNMLQCRLKFDYTELFIRLVMSVKLRGYYLKESTKTKSKTTLPAKKHLTAYPSRVFVFYDVKTFDTSQNQFKLQIKELFKLKSRPSLVGKTAEFAAKVLNPLSGKNL